jgi:predicted GNAT superfamily acetyltransferase
MATGQTAGTSGSLSTGQITLRKCEALADMHACVALQKEVWGFTDIELVPLRLFVVAAKIGGQVMGAFEGKDLVGFAFAVPGFRSGHAFLYSHMLAVRKDHRNSGLGRRLKLFQRDDAMDRGFELMEWTFDPLEIKNAYLNIEKLGAIARRYNVNQYGITSSPLQGGLPTDRLVAEWWLKSKRVQQVLTKGKRPEIQVSTTIPIPAQIYEWKASPDTRDRALQVQGENRPRFQEAFSSKQAVLGYERGPEGSGRYLIGNWDEGWSY